MRRLALALVLASCGPPVRKLHELPKRRVYVDLDVAQRFTLTLDYDRAEGCFAVPAGTKAALAGEQMEVVTLGDEERLKDDSTACTRPTWRGAGGPDKTGTIV